MEDAEKPWLYPELPQISFSDLKTNKQKKKNLSVFKCLKENRYKIEMPLSK